jgi:hypothetical protein
MTTRSDVTVRASSAIAAADETRTPEKTSMEVVDLGGAKAARLAAQPGWRWSDCIKSVVGGDSCQMRHLGVVHSGRIHIAHTDGTAPDLGPGDAYLIEPGHDAWVVGDEPFVAYEFDTTTAATFAKPT